MAGSLDAMPAVIPMLSYEDVAGAAKWLMDAFGFEEVGRWTDEDGRVSHVTLSLGTGVVMLGSPSPHYESPRRHRESCEAARNWSGTPYVVDGVLVYTRDLPAHFERAVAAGAVLLSAIEDNAGIGQRQYRVEDPEGHRWMFAERLAG